MFGLGLRTVMRLAHASAPAGVLPACSTAALPQVGWQRYRLVWPEQSATIRKICVCKFEADDSAKTYPLMPHLLAMLDTKQIEQRAPQCSNFPALDSIPELVAA